MDVRNLSLVYTLAGGGLHSSVDCFLALMRLPWMRKRDRGGSFPSSRGRAFFCHHEDSQITPGRFPLLFSFAVDCIDCAADAATVAATVEGINAALELGRREGTDSPGLTRPWVMVSVSDDEDPHFRKAGQG